MQLCDQLKSSEIVFQYHVHHDTMFIEENHNISSSFHFEIHYVIVCYLSKLSHVHLSSDAS